MLEMNLLLVSSQTSSISDEEWSREPEGPQDDD